MDISFFLILVRKIRCLDISGRVYTIRGCGNQQVDQPVIRVAPAMGFTVAGEEGQKFHNMAHALAQPVWPLGDPAPNLDDGVRETQNHSDAGKPVPPGRPR